METTSADLEIIRRVHFDRHCIEVGEYGDNPEFLELRTSDEKNIEYFGRINVSMSPMFALKLGAALMAAAREKGAE